MAQLVTVGAAISMFAVETPGFPLMNCSNFINYINRYNGDHVLEKDVLKKIAELKKGMFSKEVIDFMKNMSAANPSIEFVLEQTQHILKINIVTPDRKDRFTAAINIDTGNISPAGSFGKKVVGNVFESTEAIDMIVLTNYLD